MSDATIIGAATALIVALVGASGVWLNLRHGRITRLEARLASLEAANRRMWLIIRKQHDHAYRNGYEPIPLPDNLFDPEGE